MMFSIKLQTVIHFLQQEKQEQITMRLNYNFKTGKTLRRSVARRDVHFCAGKQVSVRGKRTAIRKYDSCTENRSE